MPANKPGSLSPDEVYALTAYLLFRNGVIEESDVMDAKESAEGPNAKSEWLRSCGAGVARTSET